MPQKTALLGKTQETQAGDEEEFETGDNAVPMETVRKDMTAMTQPTTNMENMEETPMMTSMTQSNMTTRDNPATAIGTTSRQVSRKSKQEPSPCPSTARTQQTTRRKQKTYRRHRRAVPEEEELLIAHIDPEAMEAAGRTQSEATALSNTVALSDGAHMNMEMKKLLQSHVLRGIIVGIAAALLVLQFATTLGVVPSLARVLAPWRIEAETREAAENSIAVLKENAVLAVRMRYFDSKEDAAAANFAEEEGTYCPVLWSDETWSEWTSYKKDKNGNSFYEKFYTIWITNPTKLRKHVIRGRRISCPVNVIRITKAEIRSTESTANPAKTSAQTRQTKSTTNRATTSTVVQPTTSTTQTVEISRTTTTSLDTVIEV